MTADIFEFEEYRRRKQVRDAIDDLRKSVREFDLSWNFIRSADLAHEVASTLKPDGPDAA